ncbi:hypothetical protein [Plantactinospora sp. KLBMP9567]|uniref:hypothetical protein n=1 Tax=Plantactinospora sp. KLBMP9567 TaxID=3085900 RepID=UPI002981DA52|nr:hypothetical protein [Plantactinospora sp. KLBMP9567]MDW5325666.1 hypothetical protein [Plantactinospora sp. KLBMP9567]
MVSGYRPVPLPTGAAGASRADLVAGVTGWICSPPLRDLVAAFGAELPDRLDTADLLAWLDGFAARHWDFRGRGGAVAQPSRNGRTAAVERDEVAETRLPAALTELVRAAATALGLLGSGPEPGATPSSGRRYDHLLVLGGLARSCLNRTAYAAHLLRSGAVEAGEMAALGSFRPLRPTETAELDLPGCEYEVDVLEYGMRRAFECAAPAEERSSEGEISHHSWSVRSYRDATGTAVHVLAAPSTEPASRRAHTSDTYHFWAAELGPAAGDRVLVLTSQPYVPFQHCDAVRTLGLGYGCEVRTIGLDPSRIAESGSLRQLGADQYLQELRSTIRSMRNLFHALS